MTPLALLGRFWPYLAGLALVVAAFFYGRTTMAHQRDAETARLAAKVTKSVEKARIALENVVGIAARERTQRDVEFREISRDVVRVVDRPVYRDRCGDSDLAKLLDRAAASANRPLAGGPDGGTPAPATVPAK